MKEENNNVSENNWKRIFRKKWFFPAVYLTMAALLLSGVLWYQNVANQIPDASDEDPGTSLGDEYLQNGVTDNHNEDSEPVMEQQEVVIMPVREDSQAQIVTKFYDYSADSEDRDSALVLYDNTYYQSKGVDIASTDDETFDVIASLSGMVTEVKADPLLGNVVKIEHENDLSTYYASLNEVLVETGAEVQQGDKIGTAGRNLFGQASGTHVHFQLRKDGETVNPESFFNQPVSSVESPQDEDEKEPSEEDETEGNSVEEDANEDMESSAAMANA